MYHHEIGAEEKIIKLIVISGMVLLGCMKDSNFDLDELTGFVKS